MFSIAFCDFEDAREINAATTINLSNDQQSVKSNWNQNPNHLRNCTVHIRSTQKNQSKNAIHLTVDAHPVFDTIALSVYQNTGPFCNVVIESIEHLHESYDQTWIEQKNDYCINNVHRHAKCTSRIKFSTVEPGSKFSKAWGLFTSTRFRGPGFTETKQKIV